MAVVPVPVLKNVEVSDSTRLPVEGGEILHDLFSFPSTDWPLPYPSVTRSENVDVHDDVDGIFSTLV